MNVNTCKICKHQNKNAVFFTAKEMMYGTRDEFDYFQCENCECLQISEFPVNISSYYPTNYYSFSAYSGEKFNGLTGFFNLLKYESSIFKQTPFQKSINYIFPASKFDFFSSLKINKENSILEVGCGNGNRLLYPLAELHFKSILGCDPFISKSIDYPNTLKILKTDIFTIDQKFDLIIYDHAFEHIPNPLENLNKVTELLNDGGTCILRIPTVPNYAWSLYKTNWVQLDAPRHYFIHSPKSVEYLAKEAGLRLEKIEYDSTHFQISGSEKYANNIALIAKRKRGVLDFLTRKIKKIKATKLAKKLNEENCGDQAIFYLKKSKPN